MLIEKNNNDGIIIGGVSSSSEEGIESDEVLDPFTLEGIENHIRQMRG